MYTRNEILSMNVKGTMGPFVNIAQAGIANDFSNKISGSRITGYLHYFWTDTLPSFFQEITATINISPVLSANTHLVKDIVSTITASPVITGPVHLISTINASITASPVLEKSIHLFSTFTKTIAASPVITSTVNLISTINATITASTLLNKATHEFSTFINSINVSSVLTGSYHYNNAWNNIGTCWVKCKDITYAVKTVIKGKLSI